MSLGYALPVAEFIGPVAAGRGWRDETKGGE
jgi:hypothetical protein